MIHTGSMEMLARHNSSIWKKDEAEIRKEPVKSIMKKKKERALTARHTEKGRRLLLLFNNGVIFF